MRPENEYVPDYGYLEMLTIHLQQPLVNRITTSKLGVYPNRSLTEWGKSSQHMIRISTRKRPNAEPRSQPDEFLEA